MVEGGGLCRARHVGRRHKTQDSHAEARDTKGERHKARATQAESPTQGCLICNTPVSSAASLPHVLHACLTCDRALHKPCLLHMQLPCIWRPRSPSSTGRWLHGWWLDVE